MCEGEAVVVPTKPAKSSAAHNPNWVTFMEILISVVCRHPSRCKLCASTSKHVPIASNNALRRGFMKRRVLLPLPVWVAPAIKTLQRFGTQMLVLILCSYFLSLLNLPDYDPCLG